MSDVTKNEVVLEFMKTIQQQTRAMQDQSKILQLIVNPFHSSNVEQNAPSGLDKPSYPQSIPTPPVDLAEKPRKGGG